MKIHNVQQNSPEWHRLRSGIPTASEFHNIVTPSKGELSASADGYICSLLAEYMVGHPITGPETDAMAYGSQMEEPAAKMFCFQNEVEVETCGFYTTDDCMIGASPDRRIVGQNKGVEIKSPLVHGIHVQYLIAKGIEAKYKPQVQGQLYVCEFDSIYAVSFHPELPIAVREVGRDETYIGKMKAALEAFVEVLLAKRSELDQRFGPFLKPEPDQVEEAADWLGVSDADIAAIYGEAK